MDIVYLYGASGHAKVVSDVLRTVGMKVAAFVDDNATRGEMCGVPVLHDATGLSPMIVSIGDCHVRKRIVERLRCDFATAIHPSAIIAPTVSIGEGTVVMHGAIVQADSNIGRHCIINTRASIDHECMIGDFVHIAPGCTLSGNVKVGECTWIGVGTVVKQGINIGRNCMIGAGSVVVKDIPDGVVAYGNPCRIIRQNNINEMQQNLRNGGG